MKLPTSWPVWVLSWEDCKVGYRSDVAIGIGFPNKDAMIAFLSGVKLKGDIIPMEDLAHYKVAYNTEMVLLVARFTDVKWYESALDVKCHHDLLGEAGEAGFGTAFIRIGEEYNDITVELDGGTDQEFDMWGYFNVSREVVAPTGIDFDEYINKE